MHARVLVASSNAGKVSELAAALGGAGLEVLSLRDAGLHDQPGPEEAGATYEENARLKARHYFERSGMLTIADDSGLEVDVLGGRPGLQSARYASSDSGRIARLLGELEGVPSKERTARFVCVVALTGEELAETFTGQCRGTIRHVPSGSSGFGYDPVFVPDGDTRSFAEMSDEEKRAVSHRGSALRQLVRFLEGR